MENNDLYFHVLGSLGEKYFEDNIYISDGDTSTYKDVIESISKLSAWGFVCIFFKNGFKRELLLEIETNRKLISYNILNDDGSSISFIFNGCRPDWFSINSSILDLDRFLDARKLRPDKISFVLFGGGRPKECHDKLIEESKSLYKVSVWDRNEITHGSYASFSQIMNEGIVASENEFIVFLHQNCFVDLQTMEKLISLTCSGYGLASEINFGFFVATKQLFRKCGLMDERLIGGEHEDLDWFMRMKYNNIAFYENGNNDVCPGKVKKWDTFRGLSRTIFEEKWMRVDPMTGINFFINDYYLSNFYKEEKKLVDHIKRDDIELSWMDCSKSFAKEWMSELAMRANMSICPFEEKYVNSQGVISLSMTNENIYASFNCPEGTFISINIQDMQGNGLSTCLRSNWFNILDSWKLVDGEEYEIRINHGPDRIYHNRFFTSPAKIDLNIGLRIKKIMR